MSQHYSSVPISCAIGRASPSLALIKYWGKSDRTANRPATPSLAITLQELASETRVYAIKRSSINQTITDLVVLDGVLQAAERFQDYFDGLRATLGPDLAFWAESTNNFPTAAGLASSSSGFAALTLSAAAAAGQAHYPLERLSALARLGSGSAARSLFGGFTLLPADSESAQCLHGPDFWPQLRLIIVRIDEGQKDISSRSAMEQTRLTSPFYQSWIDNAPSVCDSALAALTARDLPGLGAAMRLSYLRMFSTMFAADPPIIYWQSRSLAVIRLCASLRQQGIDAWETMDAGPQVKILCAESVVETICAALKNELAIDSLIVDQAGSGPRLLAQPQLLAAPHPLIASAAIQCGLRLPDPPPVDAQA